MTPYRTAAGYGEAEYEDKRSRFIGHIKPVTSENEAKAFIDEMRRTYADATHNVFAYVLREGDQPYDAPVWDLGVHIFNFFGLSELCEEFVAFCEASDYIEKNSFETFENGKKGK